MSACQYCGQEINITCKCDQNDEINHDLYEKIKKIKEQEVNNDLLNIGDIEC